MSENLKNFAKFQTFQLENLVDFKKCCKAYFLAKSEPIQPKTSNILPKFCQPTLSDVAAMVCRPWRRRRPGRRRHELGLPLQRVLAGVLPREQRLLAWRRESRRPPSSVSIEVNLQTQFNSIYSIHF